jgi:hypothetical protein
MAWVTECLAGLKMAPLGHRRRSVSRTPPGLGCERCTEWVKRFQIKEVKPLGVVWRQLVVRAVEELWTTPVSPQCVQPQRYHTPNRYSMINSEQRTGAIAMRANVLYHALWLAVAAAQQVPEYVDAGGQPVIYLLQNEPVPWTDAAWRFSMRLELGEQGGTSCRTANFCPIVTEGFCLF